MMNKLKQPAFIFSAAMALAAVSSCEETISDGAEGGPCRPSGVCDPGLICLSGTCVTEPPGPDTGVTPDARPEDAAGSETAPDTGPSPDTAPSPDTGPTPDLDASTPADLDAAPPPDLDAAQPDVSPLDAAPPDAPGQDTSPSPDTLLTPEAGPSTDIGPLPDMGALKVSPVIAHVPCLDHDGVSATDPDPIVVTPAAYTQQMKWIKAAGFTPMTFGDYMAKISDAKFPNNGFPARPILLFSDSSSKVMYNVAAPILKPLGFFLTLGLEGNVVGKSWVMTPAMVKALVAQGYEISSHSNSHLDLTKLSGAQLTSEVTGSRSVLLKAYGLPVPTFVYPYGWYNDTVIQAVKAAGYTGARASVGISIGGYASVDLARRYDMNCAVVYKKTTFAQVINYAANPRLELEDLYDVVYDAGTKVKIGRSNHSKDSYGTVNMGDKGDQVSVRFWVKQKGTYDLTFRVKTGIQGQPLSTAAGYKYQIYGKVQTFTQSGPTTQDSQYVVWGFHKLKGVKLAKGWVKVRITCMKDWATLLDYLTLVRVGP